jgi:integrase
MTGPQRIVCLTEEPTETLYALGEQDRIVDISGFTVRPAIARREKPKVSAFTSAKIGEILKLKWPQVDLKHGVIKLAPQDTKTERHRTIHLTKRVIEALSSQPHGLRIEHVFFNPKTGKPWNNIRKMFRRACEQAGVPDAWFHDLRRSFVTNARRRGVAESVVMRMSGHRTRAVFDRYNVVADEDVAAAVGQIEAGAAQEQKAAGLGQDLDKVEKRGS